VALRHNPVREVPLDEFIPSTLATITYQDKQWGVPHKTNAGFLYYRTDQVAFAAGGKVLSDDGAKAEINSPENLKALKFMVDGIKSGAAPKAVTTYMEEPARRSFESGKATFMRNWPYCYALAQKAPKTKGRFAVAPFPAFEGGGNAGILGGANLVISTFTKNPGGALKFIDYMTHPERQSEDIVKFSDASPLKAVYEDAAVKKAETDMDKALKTF
jgi:multiple sugar transport system substrate-binding protein